MTHCSQRGNEIIVGDLSHVFLFEQGTYYKKKFNLRQFCPKISEIVPKF